MRVTLIDTYPDFREAVSNALNPGEGLINLWFNDYMGRYGELLKLQVKCCGTEYLIKSLSELVKPLLSDLRVLNEAWMNTYAALPKAVDGVLRIHAGLPDVKVVIYVGGGCGAGWAYEYGGDYAVLLGLEMIAYHGWLGVNDLKGLITHELCHILHIWLRGLRPEEFEGLEEDPLFLLYGEGFAMKCEHLATGREWRIASGEDWLRYCSKNLSKLAREYLRTINKGESLTKFYGSWEGINGYTQTGYYLGHELINHLMRNHGLSLKEVARVEVKEAIKEAREFLEDLDRRAGS